MIEELRRLNITFGIRAIRLDVEHLPQSKILFSAKEKDSDNWSVIKMLVARMI